MNQATKQLLLNQSKPEASAAVSRYGQLYGSSLSLAIAEDMLLKKEPRLIVCPNSTVANSIAEEIIFFSQTNDVIEVFPDLEILPYDLSSPRRDILAKRSDIIFKLIKEEIDLLVINASNCLWKLPPREFFESRSLEINLRDTLSMNDLKHTLKCNGFNRVSVVKEQGEYAVRGSIIDLYSPNEIHPVRIDIDDDYIDSIRLFDKDSQLTIEKIQKTSILSANHFPRDLPSIDFFKMKMRNHFEGNQMEWPLYNEIHEDPESHGIYNYLPLFFNSMASILDYISSQTKIYLHESALTSLPDYEKQIFQRFADYQSETQPIMHPGDLFFKSTTETQKIQERCSVLIQPEKFSQSKKNESLNFNTEPVTLRMSGERFAKTEKLLQYTKEQAIEKLLISAPTKKKEAIITNFLKSHEIKITKTNEWSEFIKSDKGFYVTNQIISKGFALNAQNTAVLGETDLFGQGSKRILGSRRQQNPETIIENLKDLRKGTLVVHKDYGIGQYDGLTKLIVDDVESEYICINYAKGDLLQLPITQMDKVSRYIGDSNNESLLSYLGNDQWKKICRKAKTKAQDVAAELLELYAKRNLTIGKNQPINEYEYEQFCSGFHYILTRDQGLAIDHVLDDMSSSKKMDRLVCGDVGFGKTEVALRASFCSVMNGNQVVIMVPTTLLAQQHYDTFQERFSDWPVNIELLSRTQGLKKRKHIIGQIKSGETDIIIGTHAVLSEKIKYPNLGLVIVDEEHRFGVRHKEQLKKIRHAVDYLAMTATPIPRTLNMAIGELKDISMISTPPESRLAVKTYIHRWEDALIKEACQRELNRGGQILFVHNQIKDIEEITDQLRKILPGISIDIAHGRMKERTLEKRMMQYYNNQFSLLVATTIIESGLDIPNANTIIINNANQFGLAQLHQLRGRVGRSERQSYAYLLTPPKQLITPDGLKRLEAIEAIEDLGVGFILATHDLEIRGAGEILGDEQSGQIQKIGYSLYKDLLEEAINSYREDEGTETSSFMTEINLNIPNLITEEFMPDVHLRLTFYKRISVAKNNNEIKSIAKELKDRFGTLPDFTLNLLELTKLKLIANNLGIEQIKMNKHYGRLHFHPSTQLETDRVLKLINNHEDKYRLYPDQSLGFKVDTTSDIDKINEIKFLLDYLTNHQVPLKAR